MRASAVLLAFVLLPAAIASPLDFRPVDSALLSGRTLLNDAENFSVDAPDGWTWSIADVADGHVYLCRPDSDTQSFVVLSQADGRRHILERSADSFMRGFSRSVEDQGIRVASLTRQPSDVLFPDSYAINGTGQAPNG